MNSESSQAVHYPTWMPPRWLLAVIGILAALLRLSLVFAAPPPDKQSDIGIYMEAGRLMRDGINPYDYDDNPELRTKARLDDWAYRPFTSESQERWDYYISGNLPLSTLVWTAIDVLWPSQFGYQISFLIFDSLACVAAAAFMLYLWDGPNDYRWRLALAFLFIGASPQFLTWGTLVAEDKGVSLLIISIGLLLCADKRTWVYGGFALGCGISYKLVGIFFLPVGIYLVQHVAKQSGARRWGAFITAVTLGTIIWFFPFGPHAIEKCIARFFATETLSAPGHASVWRIINDFLPGIWKPMRLVLCACLGLWSFFMVIKGRLKIELWVAYLSTIYVGLWLIGGSPDRFGMVAYPMILVLGLYSWRSAVRLATIHFITGLVCMGFFALTFYYENLKLLLDRELPAAASIAIFVMSLSMELLRLSARQHTPTQEI